MNEYQTSAELFDPHKYEPQRFFVVTFVEGDYIPSPFFITTAVKMKFTEKDFYWADKGYAMFGTTLMRVAGAANIRITDMGILDTLADPDLAIRSVSVQVRMPDGTMRPMYATKTVNVNEMIQKYFNSNVKKRSEGDAKMKGKSDAELMQLAEANRQALRQYKAERAETGALARAIRGILALPGTFTKEQCSKIFVFPVVQANMSLLMADENLRQMAAAHALGLNQEMYPQRKALHAVPQQTAPQIGTGTAPAQLTAGTQQGAGAGETTGTHQNAQQGAPGAAQQGTQPAAQGADVKPAMIVQAVGAHDWGGTKDKPVNQIRLLLQSRNVQLNQADQDKMLNSPEAKQLKYIEWLQTKPVRPVMVKDEDALKEAWVQAGLSVQDVLEEMGVEHISEMHIDYMISETMKWKERKDDLPF